MAKNSFSKYVGMWLLLFLCSCTTLEKSALSDGVLTEEDEASDRDRRLKSVMKAQEVIDHLSNELGYDDIRISGFSRTNSRTSFTVLANGQDEAKYKYAYFSEIRVDSNGPYILFRVFTLCIPSDQLGDRVIRINGQNIKTRSFCAYIEGNEGDTQMLYLPTSLSAKKYIYRAFSENEFVIIDFSDLEVPIDTEGFEEQWNRVNSPVL